MANPPPPPDKGLSLDGIEVVELSDVDADFAAYADAFKRGASPALEKTQAASAKSDDISSLELFHGLGEQDMAHVRAQCQSIQAVPGYVLLAPGRLNTKLYFVVEGQLRLYPQTGDKRPIAIVDMGQSTGLRSALVAQPANHAVIATELSHVIGIEVAALEELAKRSHAFARNYAALLASYLRGDNCLNIGTRAAGQTARQSYIDELTLLHNQYWLDTVFPRLVARCRLGEQKLAVTAFGIHHLDDIVKQHGSAAGLRVLQTVGHWILDHTRPTDLLAVNSDRHFFAFLPDCDREAAKQLANRLHVLFKTVPVWLDPAKKQGPVKLELAFGIAELEAGMKESEFLTRAEAQVQKALMGST